MSEGLVSKSYIEEHPTNFNWRYDVQQNVWRIQNKFPWMTFINTYYWHPPYNPPAITKRYDRLSFDVWGGGRDRDGKYIGYRGKPLEQPLYERVFNFIFNMGVGPWIDWILCNGWMWQAGKWTVYDPPDPQGADMGHYKHIHVTYK